MKEQWIVIVSRLGDYGNTYYVGPYTSEAKAERSRDLVQKQIDERPKRLSGRFSVDAAQLESMGEAKRKAGLREG